MTTALTTTEPAPPVVALTAAQVRQVHDEIAAVVTAADTAIETLRELCGPEPGDFAATLRTKLNMGAGYFRSCAADIEAAWRARNVRARVVSEEPHKPQQL